MLFIRQVKHLVNALNTTIEELSTVVGSRDAYYEELLLIDPAKPEKQRVVVDVRGMMCAFQTRLYRRILLPKLRPSVYSHGGVRGRDIKSNAQPHIRSQFVFKTDISNYFPSIHYKRVYRLFTESFKCSPDVARLCTGLCTYRHHLALGLITSPILADQVLSRVDRRIGGACEKARLKYTRFVDDITISGPYDLKRSGFVRLVESILEDDGFKVSKKKQEFGRLSEGTPITGVRAVRGHLDARREYIDELERQLDDAASLARGGDFVGPYYTPAQILGRVRFVCWVNPGRRRQLIRRYRSIRWSDVSANARGRGLVVTRKRLTKIDRNGSADSERGG